MPSVRLGRSEFATAIEFIALDLSSPSEADSLMEPTEEPPLLFVDREFGDAADAAFRPDVASVWRSISERY
jgi:hypothetical protein